MALLELAVLQDLMREREGKRPIYTERLVKIVNPRFAVRRDKWLLARR